MFFDAFLIYLICVTDEFCVCVCGRRAVMCLCVSSLQPGAVTLVQSLGAEPQVRPQHGTETKLCVFVPVVCV